MRATGGALLVAALSVGAGPAAGQDSLVWRRIEVPSALDGTVQPSNLWVPPTATPVHPAPLAVLLHTWSGDLDQRHPVIEREAVRRGWILLEPNFRGKNDHPGACGSPEAQQDVIEAVAWVRARYPVDGGRIYALDLSGGGHMTLLVTARAPELWAAASAWVGIADFAAYERAHAADEYGAMARQCVGGGPDDSPALAERYRSRSPVETLHQAVRVPIEIAAGRADSDVVMTHSVLAFNRLARAAGVAPVSDAELAELLRPGAGLARPTAADTAADPIYGRRIFLRRWAGPSRLTVFDGGHTWVPAAAVAWLAEHRKDGRAGSGPSR